MLRIVLDIGFFYLYKVLCFVASFVRRISYTAYYILFNFSYTAYYIVFKILASTIMSAVFLILGTFITCILSFLFLAGGIILLFGIACAAWYYAPSTLAEYCSKYITKGSIYVFTRVLKGVAKCIKKWG